MFPLLHEMTCIAVIAELSYRHTVRQCLSQLQCDEEGKHDRRRVLDEKGHRYCQCRLNEGNSGEKSILSRTRTVAEAEPEQSEQQRQRTAGQTHTEGAEQYHGDKAEDEAAGLSYQHSEASVEGGKYGSSYGAERNINADGGDGAGQGQGKAAQGYRKGLEGYRNTYGQRNRDL